MTLLSVIIPSRNCKYVSRTVDDIFQNATGDTECIVLLDGYWPNPPIKDYPKLTIVHKPVVKGMRHSLNLGVQLAKGKFIMKTDDHCMFGKGFDEILAKDCEDNWLAVPSRYAMNVEKWEKTRGPTEYLYITYPYLHDNLYGNGLHGKKWIGEDGFGINMGIEQFYWRETHRKHILIDDIMTFQGSCWFMTKKHYLNIGMLDEKRCDLMENEPQELGFKTWLSGGRCVRNKNTWYAHMHKNERELDERGRTWKLSWQAMRDTGRFQTYIWMHDLWTGIAKGRGIEWFVNYFWPIPGWPMDWEKGAEKYAQEHPGVWENFRIFDPDGVDGLPLN